MSSILLRRLAPLASLVPAVLLFAACEQNSSLPSEVDRTDAVVQSAKPVSDANVARIKAAVDKLNARFEAAGSPVRVAMPWMFTKGYGVDQFANLRTGYRWSKKNVEYVLDESDYSSDLPASEVETAMVNAYQSWTDIGNTYVQVNRAADDGQNNDLADGIVRDASGACVDFFDYTATPWLKDADGNLTGEVEPTTDILVAGFAPAEYFADCLGSESIIAVTWTFFLPDGNGDNYQDIWFVEQIYNEGFDWTTTESEYLDFDAPFDVETIAAHENGHALGLDHFGGPVVDSQYKLKGQNRVFNPEAVMNPYYIGGEKRTPLKTDVAGLRTLYTGHVSTTPAH